MGRPRKDEDDKFKTPARQFGRVSDSDWELIKEACELSGMSLVSWALPTLLAKARREKSQREKQK